MIISPRHGFIFVHVPKCAGTSVRTQLIACDPTHIALAQPGTHPVLGQIDYGHIPLTDLRAHFPEHFNYLCNLRSFAVMRDPLSRFGSSLRQTLWRYEQKHMTLIAPDVLRTRTLEILDEVAAEIEKPSAKFIFFARQTDFTFEEGIRRVNHLVPIEHVGAFITFIAAETGTPMDADRRSNQNVELRAKWLGPTAFAVNGFLRKRLPLDIHDRIKQTALRLLSSRKNAADESGILKMPEVRQFVDTYYAEDQKLYAQAQAEAPALLQAFADRSLQLNSPGA